MDRYLRFSNTAKGVCFVMRAYERLLDYVKVYTTSDPESGTHPSAAREFDLAHKLVEELKALGVEDARVDEHCYVYGSLPATPGCEEKPALGLIAHMDTAPDASGENVNPEELEGLLETCPAVKECLVKEKGKKICAVVCCEEADQQTVRDFITETNRTLPLYKRMSAVEFSAQPLPRNAMGKLMR